MSESATSLSPAVTAAQRIPAALWVGVIASAATIFYWLGFESLYEAWQKPEYSHGFIIPVIAAFLLLKRLDLAAPAGRGEWLGLALVVAGLALGLFGRLAVIADIVTYGFLLLVGGILLITAGSRRMGKLWPAWAYLGFMLPLPNFIYWPLSIKLQFLSSEIGVFLIKLIGVPVFLDGNIIDLGSYKLQVAEACSGLRYLFPLASFSFLFATLYRGPIWHKVIIFLAAAPITVMMNSARIAVIGFLVDRYGSKQAEGFLHFFEGWVIFIACILLLFGLAALLQRLQRQPAGVMAVIDVDTAGLRDRLRVLLTLPGTPMLALAALIVVLATVAGEAVGGRSAVYPDRRRFTDFPMTIGAWNGTSSYLDFEIERVLAADDYVVADYRAASEAVPVGILVAYYRAQNEGSGIHSPEVCIPAGGWEVSRWEQAQVAIADPVIGTLKVNRAIIQKGLVRQLVYYWFEQRDRRYTNDYAFKFSTVWSSVVSGRSDGALIRVITGIDSGGVAAAEQRLKDFMAQSLPQLRDFVPP